jgi:hypothetical protein
MTLVSLELGPIQECYQKCASAAPPVIHPTRLLCRRRGSTQASPQCIDVCHKLSLGQSDYVPPAGTSSADLKLLELQTTSAQQTSQLRLNFSF